MDKMQSFKKNKCNIEESLPYSSSGNESACSVGDPGLIPGSGRSSGEGNGNPLQCSCLENAMDRGVWRAPVHWITVLDTTEQLTILLEESHST